MAGRLAPCADGGTAWPGVAGFGRWNGLPEAAPEDGISTERLASEDVSVDGVSGCCALIVSVSPFAGVCGVDDVGRWNMVLNPLLSIDGHEIQVSNSRAKFLNLLAYNILTSKDMARTVAWPAIMPQGFLK